MAPTRTDFAARLNHPKSTRRRQKSTLANHSARASRIPILRESPWWSVSPPRAGGRKPPDRQVANGCEVGPAFSQSALRAAAASPFAPRRCRRIPPRVRAGMPHSARLTVHPSSKVAPVAAPRVESHPSAAPPTAWAAYPSHRRCARRLPLTTSGAPAGRIRGRDGFLRPTRATARAPRTLHRIARSSTRRVASGQIRTSIRSGADVPSSLRDRG